MDSQVKIKLFAMFREIVGKKEITHGILPEATLGELLDELAREYGREFTEIIDKKTSQINLNTIVMLNGANTRNIGVKLKNGDLIIITIPVGGG